jgi:hypothetical protein
MAKLTSKQIIQTVESSLIAEIENAINNYPGLDYNGVIEEMFGININDLGRLPTSKLIAIKDFVESF